jgi:hypothetical protein
VPLLFWEQLYAPSLHLAVGGRNPWLFRQSTTDGTLPPLQVRPGVGEGGGGDGVGDGEGPGPGAGTAVSVTSFAPVTPKVRRSNLPIAGTHGRHEPVRRHDGDKHV